MIIKIEQKRLEKKVSSALSHILDSLENDNILPASGYHPVGSVTTSSGEYEFEFHFKKSKWSAMVYLLLEIVLIISDKGWLLPKTFPIIKKKEVSMMMSVEDKYVWDMINRAVEPLRNRIELLERNAAGEKRSVNATRQRHASQTQNCQCPTCKRG